MKQECPTYLKSIEKSKAFAATLSDTEFEDDSDKKDDGILNAFTATVNPIEGIVEEPQSLMKQIRLLEHWDLRIISWQGRPRSLKQSYFKLELNSKRLQVRNLMRCLAFRNQLLIELVWGMISLFLKLFLLVLLCLFLLLIMLNLRTMMWNLF